MTVRRLPKGFDQLEEFIDTWVLPSETARLARRLETDFEELKRFYSAAIEQAPAALDRLNQFAADDRLAAEDERLLGLMLALAEVAPAVELFGTTVEPDVYDPTKVEIVHEAGLRAA